MLRPGVLLLFNVRPPEYWTLHDERHDHRGTGPWRLQMRERQDGHGELSVSLRHVEEVCRTARQRDLRVDWSAGDPHQYLLHP